MNTKPDRQAAASTACSQAPIPVSDAREASIVGTENRTQMVSADPTDPSLTGVESAGAASAPHSVDAIAEVYILQLRQGEGQEVEELAAEHPDHEQSIRALFPTIRALEQLRARRSSPGASMGLNPPIERLGDLRIIRQIGRGGMGIVFEAEQETLGRRVAVKVLPRAVLLEEQQLKRFQREARTAAGLHHTNIVPVLGVGEYEGWHYYVMQLIDGVGLDAHLRRCHEGARQEETGIAGAPRQPARRPSTPFAAREVARLGIQAADALHYAHARGVLHRDVKPANLLLDSDGTLWIADFGLARPLAEDDATRTGHAAGTLRYMAPEQFFGHTDVRSDIYSLGLTLYELLTGRPAFPDPRLREVRGNRRRGDAPPIPHTIHPDLPRDLETIVLKAIAEEPERRYSTAAELSAELRRFLEDRPILARRASPLERFARWARRNPALAASGAVVALALLLIAAISSTAYFRIQHAFRAEANARHSAEANARLAADALNQIFNRFAVNRLGNDDDSEEFPEPASQPVLSREAARLLEELLAYYDRLGEQSAANPNLLWRAAEARRQVGDIHQQMGQFEQAITAYTSAREHYERASDRVGTPNGPTPLSWRIARSRVQNGLGTANLILGRTREAKDSYQLSLNLLLDAPESVRRDPALRCELARTHYLTARRLLPGMGPLAMPPLLDDLPRPRPLDRPEPYPQGPRPGPTPVSRPSPQGHDPTEREHLHQAVKILGELVQEHPTSPRYRLLLAACYREQASDLLSQRTEDDKKAELIAIDLLKELVAQYPDNPSFRYELAQAYGEISVFGDSLAPEHLTEAVERLRVGQEHAEDLVAQHPHVSDFAMTASHNSFKLGMVYERMAMQAQDEKRRSELFESAERSYRKAVNRHTAIVKQAPQATAHAVWLALFQQRLGVALGHAQLWDDSLWQLSRAIRGLSSLLETDPHQTRIARQLSTAYHDLAETMRRKGDMELSRRADKESAHWALIAFPQADATERRAAGPTPPHPPWNVPRPPPPRRGPRPPP